MSWSGGPPGQRLILREAEEPTIDSGIHRPLELPEDATILKRPLGDRAPLSCMVAAVMEQTGAEPVCVAVPGGAYWLNNKGYASRLAEVPDAQRVHRRLRAQGLTDRFRGGFLVRPYEFRSWLPLLASQPFCGGPDVFFIAARVPLIVMACHEFDLHVDTRHDAVFSEITRLAAERNLLVRGHLTGGPIL